MAKFIAIANQKGGVGKTTTAMNLGVALKLQGKRVLLVDFDSQANLSEYLGFENDVNQEKLTISDLMLSVISNKKVNVKECIYKNTTNDIDYIPSSLDLATIENYLSSAISRETVLKRVFINSDIVNQYDYIIIDCPPTLAVLLINTFTLCDAILIPVQTHKFALDGLIKLNDVFLQIKEVLNNKLEIIGILPTMTDNTNISKNVLDNLKNTYQDLVINTIIPRCVEAPNSTESGISVCLQKNSKLSDAYINLSKEVINRN